MKQKSNPAAFRFHKRPNRKQTRYREISIREKIAAGKITLNHALLTVPGASDDTKRKWKKTADAYQA